MGIQEAERAWAKAVNRGSTADMRALQVVWQQVEGSEQEATDKE